MSWRDNIRPAKFRGVEFHVETADLKGGRRGPVHEFPQRDIPWREDLGRKARGFSVEGYIVGEEYLAAKNQLIAKLEEEGPGELVHPYYGTLRVAVGDFTVRESRADGGVARFSIEFLETTPNALQPSSVADASTALGVSADDATAAVGEDFLSRYAPGTLMDSISGAVTSATQEINDLLPALPFDAQTIAGLRARLAGLLGSLSALIDSPAALFAGLSDLFGDIAGVGVVGPPVPTSAMIKIYAFDPGVRPPATTPNRVQERANFDAVVLLVRRLAVIQAARLAPIQPYVSYEDAITARGGVLDLIDEQAETAPDDTFIPMLNMRGTLTQALPGTDSELPQLVSYTPPANVPSIVLAHRLYGNLDLEADLIARNGVKHPGFIRGLTSLEILSRG